MLSCRVKILHLKLCHLSNSQNMLLVHLLIQNERYGIEGMKDEKCMGKAAEGFFTPPASTSATQFKCGDDLVFCPEGSSSPIKVSKGYYSVGSTNAATRSSQMACETTNQRSPIGPPKYYRDNTRNQTFNLWCPSSTNYVGKEIHVPYHIDVNDKYRYNYRFE